MLINSLRALVLSTIVAGLSVAQADNARYTINPSTFVPGKSYTVTIQDTRCPAQDSTDTSNLTSAKPVASGSGIKIAPSEPALAHKCDWTGTLTVGQDAETGDFNVVVPASTTESSLIAIKVIAKAAGPLPPGLQPTVDVAWGVLPRRISSDNFGGRITKLYYPIQVVIGNNSGYDLQLASIQFKLPDAAALDGNVPNDSYYMVRSSLQREQLVGARNTTVNIIKAIGPILTGSTVFFDGASAAALHHKSIFQGLTNVFSNPFEKGLEVIFPDQTVQQLINLDNHSLRDGIIIANNTQIRTIAFVNKDLLVQSALASGRVPPGGSAAALRQAADTALVGEIKAADSLLAAEFMAADSALANEIAAADNVRTGKIANARERSDALTAVDIAAADNEAMSAKAVAAQRAAAAKAAATARAAIAKRTAIRTSSRMEARALGGGGGNFSKHEYDEQEVMRQLGSLQLIGRSIAYLNRVSVISNPPGAGPQFILSPTSVTQGASGNDAIALTLTGDGLSGGTLTPSNKDLVISNQKVGDGGKSFTATLNASKAAPATYTLTLTTSAASQSAQFEVKPAAPITIDTTQSPPISVSVGVSDKAFAVTGTNLKNVVKVEADSKCPQTVVTQDTSVPLEDTKLHIKISALSATPPSCTATVTGLSGSPATFTYTVK